MGDSMDIIYNLRGGVNFVRGKLQTTTSYKNWGKYKTGNMGLEFYLYSVEPPLCAFSWITWVCWRPKKTVLPSPMRILYSPSPNIVGHNAVTEMAFLLHPNIINIQGHSLYARDFFSKWEINIEKYHEWSP